jgi:hypothetical protein
MIPVIATHSGMYSRRPTLREFQTFGSWLGFVSLCSVEEWKKSKFRVFILTPWQISKQSQEIIKSHSTYNNERKTNFGVYWPPEHCFMPNDVIQYNNGSLKFEDVRTLEDYITSPQFNPSTFLGD